MRKLIYLIVFLSSTLNLHAQWSNEMALNSGINEGWLWPRITTVENGTYVIWGNSATDRIHGVTVSEGKAGSQQILNAGEEPAFITDWASTEISSYDDVISVVYKSDNAQTGSSYVILSQNGGQSFQSPEEIINGQEILHRFPAIYSDASGFYVSYMRFEDNFLEPQYDLRHFTNTSFTEFNDIQISESLDGEVCDCCVSAITGNEQKTVVLFRNNNNNFRDIHAGIVDKSNLTIQSHIDLNAASWQLFSCPSTGADGLMDGPLLHAVYMSRHSGTPHIYLSTVDSETDSLLSERQLFSPGTIEFSNFPRIAGSGDTLGVVWQGAERRDQNVYFTYSTTGPDGLGDTILLLSEQTDGRQGNPDIAFQDGTFHMAWQDNSTSLVMFRSFDLSELTTSVKNDFQSPPTVEVIKTGDHILIEDISSMVDCQMINMEGKVYHLPVQESYNISDYTPGIYVLRLIRKDNSAQTFKFTKS